MSKTTSPTVSEYFAGKASQYDDVDHQRYWMFSDDLLWYLLKTLCLPANYQSSFHLIDAGAGTARWSSKILEAYPQATANLTDLSTEMLMEAAKKLAQAGMNQRVNITQGDVRELDHIPDQSADFLICFHNVLGFFTDTQTALDKFFSKLKTGGTAALMFPSFYHAIYFSNSTGRATELERIKQDRHVKFNDLMPPLKVFEISEIHDMLKTAGFKKSTPYGFPLTTYPGMEETMIHGSTESLDSIMSNTHHRSHLMDLEKKLCLQSALAARGNNLLFIARK